MARLLLAWLLIVVPIDASAAGGLDVQGQMRRPGVKLVAVEFFADWCPPCKAAVPRWKKLHEKYREKGLRLIVISAGERGACSSPGWNPDQTICDLDGSLQEAFGAKALPQAFLWSWQGNLLASHADVETVEKAIIRYFKDTPRVLIANPTNQTGRAIKDGHAIRESVRTELRKQAKFDVVAGGKDLDVLRKLQKQVHDPAYEQEGKCPLGGEVSPNSELKIKLMNMGSGNRTLALQLYSVEKGCLLAASQARVVNHGIEESIFEAVTALVEQLIGSPRNAGGGSSAGPGLFLEQGGRAEYEPYKPEGSVDVVVKLESVPPGMKVSFRGATICQETPCNAEIQAGPASFVFSDPTNAFEGQEVRAEVKPGMKPVAAHMVTTRGQLTVSSTPAGIPVTLDGRVVGNTPQIALEISEGRHRVEVGDKVFVPEWKEFVLRRGEKRSLSFSLKARQGGVKVKARDARGNPLSGRVFIDGTEVGNTGQPFAVNIGEHQVEARTEAGVTSQKVLVRQGKTEEIVLKVVSALKPVQKTANKDGFIWVLIPSGTFIMGCSLNDDDCSDEESPPHKVTIRSFFMLETEVTEQQYQAVMGTNPSCGRRGAQGPNLPVECVDWVNAKQFCQRIGGRLPTEAEWEYSARGGTTTRYYCGDDKGCLDGIAWHGSNSGWKKHAVKGKLANGFGLFDMIGNVWEWTEDNYHSDYEGAPSDGSAWITADNAVRVSRGGGFYRDPDGWYKRVSTRDDYDQRFPGDGLGFRCARSK